MVLSRCYQTTCRWPNPAGFNEYSYSLPWSDSWYGYQNRLNIVIIPLSLNNGQPVSLNFTRPGRAEAERQDLSLVQEADGIHAWLLDFGSKRKYHWRPQRLEALVGQG